MSDGVHVFHLPVGVAEKQLKVYFSNPRNGGGHVRQILHPLPHDSAVIMFDNPHTVKNILRKQHVMKEQKLSVQPLPKQIFGVTTVELETGISKYIERTPTVVDELQYVGDLKVDFHYEKEIYILTGNWYQLEWALHYLDSLLSESDIQQEDKSSKDLERGWRNLRREYGEMDEEMDEEYVVPEPVKHEIKKPNIPMVNRAAGGAARNYGAAGKNDRTDKREGADGSYRGLGRAGIKYSTDSSSKYAGRTVRQNLDSGGAQGKVDYESINSFKQAQGDVRKTNKYDDSGSDDDNYGSYYTSDMGQYGGRYGDYYNLDKSVTFSNDTDFSENKPRPSRMLPKRTRGIDVAQTDFGEVPLAHEFTMSNDLKVKVLKDDISKQSTDGIINPSSPDLMSMFGASRAIVQAGGIQMQREMQEYIKKNGNLGWAEVCHTKPGGTLHQNVVSVLHTVSPGWNEENSEEATHYLVCTYINCLVYADSKLWLQSIATPVISSGNFGFPLDVCIQAFYDALLLFSTHGQANSHLKEVHLVCFDDDTSMAAIVLLQSLFDCDTTQAVSAATDRYNTRYLKSNFAAENFSTDETVGAGSRSAKQTEDKLTQQRKQQKNKNAERNAGMSPGQSEGLSMSSKNETQEKMKSGGRLSNNDLLKRYRTKQNQDYKAETGHAEFSERSDSGRISPKEMEKSGSLKGSLRDIERPKFTANQDDHDDSPTETSEFSVGIIGADQYFKKFEDLIVVDDKPEDGGDEGSSDENEGEETGEMNAEKEVSEQSNKDREREKSGIEDQADYDEGLNVDLNGSLDHDIESNDKVKKSEIEAIEDVEKKVGEDTDNELPELNQDIEENKAEAKCVIDEYSLLDEDKAISAALDRELGFEMVSKENDFKESLSKDTKMKSESSTGEHEEIPDATEFVD